MADCRRTDRIGNTPMMPFLEMSECRFLEGSEHGVDASLTPPAMGFKLLGRDLHVGGFHLANADLLIGLRVYD